MSSFAVGFERPAPRVIRAGAVAPSAAGVKAGVVDLKGPKGDPGEPGPQGAAAGYNHTQSSALDTWTINHNLGYMPSVEVFSVGGMEMIAEVQHISVNQTVVRLASAAAGAARLI